MPKSNAVAELSFPASAVCRIRGAQRDQKRDLRSYRRRLAKEEMLYVA
jgi:hypothetical protein